MVRIRPDDSGGFFSRYINPNSDTLIGRFDFFGMIGDGMKAVLVLLATTLAGAALATQRAIGQVFWTGFNGFREAVNTVLSAPQITAETAFQTATSEIQVFGIAALPVGVVVAVAAVASVSIIFYVFTGVE